MTEIETVVYNQIRDNPGIRFGFTHSLRAKMARKLAESKLVYWSERYYGWFVNDISDKTSEITSS